MIILVLAMMKPFRAVLLQDLAPRKPTMLLNGTAEFN